MSGNIRLYNSGGYVELQAPANAVSQTLVLPTDSIQPALVHINTTTFSAVSSVSLNDVFTATYDNYLLIYFADVATGNSNLNLRLRVGGVDASGSNYTRQILSADGSGVSASKNTTTFHRVGDLDGGSIAAGTTNIFRPAIAAKTAFNSYADGAYGSANLNLITGSHSLATAYDGFTLLPSASTITGTLRIYGYKNGA